MTDLKYPDHPILTAPWVYQVTDLHYHGMPWDKEDPFLDLTLTKGTETVQLRFIRPISLTISEDFPTQLGLFISDISTMGWEGILIEVGDFENQSIHFYAKAVKRCEHGEGGKASPATS